MKNIAHFATGLALASFVPGVMQQAAQGSLLIALGGACAMLPDVLDFRLARYLIHVNANIRPDSVQPDAQQIAEQIASQVQMLGHGNDSRVVQLHPRRRSAAEWVTYSVAFDIPHGDVVVCLDEGGAVGRVHAGPLDHSFEGPVHVDELGGPALRFCSENGSLHMEFLPWHRQWTHSLFLALLLGLVCAWLIEPRAGMVAVLGYSAHILADVGGHMGSNLFSPFTRKRSKGLGLYHSVDAIPNVVTVWVSLTLLLLNMDRIQASPIISLGPYLAFAVALPACVLLGVYVRRSWRSHVHQIADQQQHDPEAEADANAFGN